MEICWWVAVVCPVVAVSSAGASPFVSERSRFLVDMTEEPISKLAFWSAVAECRRVYFGRASMTVAKRGCWAEDRRDSEHDALFMSSTHRRIDSNLLSSIAPDIREEFRPGAGGLTN